MVAPVPNIGEPRQVSFPFEMQGRTPGSREHTHQAYLRSYRGALSPSSAEGYKKLVCSLSTGPSKMPAQLLIHTSYTSRPISLHHSSFTLSISTIQGPSTAHHLQGSASHLRSLHRSSSSTRHTSYTSRPRSLHPPPTRSISPIQSPTMLVVYSSTPCPRSLHSSSVPKPPVQASSTARDPQV